MFVLCPHCQFLVGVDPRTGAPPATCPKCGGALDALDAVGADAPAAPAAAAEAPAPALDAAAATAAPEPVDATARVPATGTDPASEPHPVPGTPLAPESTAAGPSADDLVAAMAARPSRTTRKRPASEAPRRADAAAGSGRRRAKAPAPMSVPTGAAPPAAEPGASGGSDRPAAAAGWWQRWRRRMARPAAAPAAGPAPAPVAPAPAPAAPLPDNAPSASPSATAPDAAGAQREVTTPHAPAPALPVAPAARGWRGWRLRRSAPVPATPAPGVASASASAATSPGATDAADAPAPTPAPTPTPASTSAPATATAAAVEAAPLPPTAVPIEADTDAAPLPPTAGTDHDPARAHAAPHADRAVPRNDAHVPPAVATPADPAPAAVAEAAPFIERRRPPEVVAREGAPPGHPLRRRTDPAPSFARAQAAPAPGGRRWIPLAVAAALGVLLVLQLLLAQRATLAADARWRPVLAGLCRVLPCTLPPWREPAAFTMLSRDVRAHPQVPGALLVDASFRNDARWPQPWPRVVLTLSNVEGRVVGARAFQARDYLGEESATTQTTLAPGQTAAIRLAIVEPAPDVVAFSFDFR